MQPNQGLYLEARAIKEVSLGLQILITPSMLLPMCNEKFTQTL